MSKQIIAVPLGDPAGIGPEIVVKALASPDVNAVCGVVVVGDRSVVDKALEITGVSLAVREITDPAEGDYSGNTLNLINLNNIQGDYAFGVISARCGQAAYDYIAKSVELAMAKKVQAVATPPINKEALRAANVPFIGHTEIFGSLTGTADPLTMFEVRNLRIFFLTRHVSLAQACTMVKKDRIMDYIRRCTAALKQLGAADGTMAVAGLNPHSGEHGLFGWDEVNEVEPAVKAMQAEGYDVTGPIGADSVFHLAKIGRFNSVLSLYHDQGHIAAKTLDFDRTIAITLGMPILRTSVDHGTAFDVAGKGIASAISMEEALLLAAKYAPHFTQG